MRVPRQLTVAGRRRGRLGRCLASAADGPAVHSNGHRPRRSTHSDRRQTLVFSVMTGERSDELRTLCRHPCSALAGENLPHREDGLDERPEDSDVAAV